MKLGRRDFIGGVAAAMVSLSIAGGGVEQGMGTAAVEPFFFGDSITQNGVAVTWVAAHYRKMLPKVNVRFSNVGISGKTRVNAQAGRNDAQRRMAESVRKIAAVPAVQQRYTPVPGGFEIRNGASEFMRPLYGWHGDDDIRQPKRSMPSTSDRPKVALKVFDGMRLDKKARGVLSFGDGTEDVTFRYVWGRAEYDLKGKGTVKMVALQGERPHVLRRAEARRTHTLHAPQGPDLQHVRGVRGFRAALLALDRR